MAEARVGREENFDAKFAALQREINQTFEYLHQALENRKQELLSRLTAMKTAHDKNTQLDEAIKQLRIVKEKAIETMTSNLLNTMKESFDIEIRTKEEMKISVENVSYIEFRSLSEHILKGIEETGLVELIPEYVGRDNPILKTCSLGTANGEFRNAKGIAIDRNTNEVYISDKSNHRIQVMNTNGEFLRSFGHDQLKIVYDICLSENELFVTDKESFLLKFNKSGKFLKKAGSRGTKPGCFNDINGLCYDEGLIYVCDLSIQRILIFDSELKFLKQFAYGEIKHPTDINIHYNIIYILSLDQNVIYCYNKDCQQLSTILLTGQKVQMTTAFFFVIDTKGNFLITDNTLSEIRIFSPNGELKHTLGRGHLRFLTGIAIDNSGAIICINYGEQNDCFQKY